MIFQRKSLMADEHEKSDTEIYDSDVMDLDGYVFYKQFMIVYLFSQF